MFRSVRQNRDEYEVLVSAGRQSLPGSLTIPDEAMGIVLFAHGSGSSRLSPRNRAVASELNRAGLGTLLFDLLSPEEERTDALTGALRFDIGLLSDRLAGATDWVTGNPETQSLKLGYFGASTGAAAALIAAARHPRQVDAVVSRGGRPDLAGPVLPSVQAPTLLIVGGNDHPVIQMNEHALRQLRCEKELQIVPQADHLFEGPGQLDAVAKLAIRWFQKYLATPQRHF